MLFDIRAELADGTCRDFRQVGHDNYAAKTSAAKAARDAVDADLRREFGADVRTEWRGMVVFVNRPVPCANLLPPQHPLARYTKGARRR